ncbi:hypothetical protein FIA58_009735 [Flavobacterium jejuense]|uniref:HMA domain-containing protein n=1 Tax=Flavobacterium jejuense TaxID=1544455 RepID=A0ABX0IT11_9FLAO|nr:hypothetical protein [Flavobacterium jejuense]NHN25954.1 hypothetical protein [Flavobacterium jejuense]
MVEVYKTNINSKKKAKQVISVLQKILPTAKINFDLEDCDNILRIETSMNAIDATTITKLIDEQGFYMEALPDN